MSDIFLSYKREDRRRAKLLVDILEAKGWTVFWDRELLAGVEYRQVITEELAQARCVVVLWSKLAVESDWVVDEATEGLRRGILVPVLIENVDPPLGFRQVHTANLAQWQGESSESQLDVVIKGVSRLEVLLAKLPAPTATTQTSPIERVAPTASASQALRAAATLLARRKLGLRSGVFAPTALLALLFLVNFLQTAGDAALTPASIGRQEGYPIAQAFRWFEDYLSFESHDATNAIAYQGYSISYFFLFPLLCLGVALAFARRKDPTAYRTFCLAVAIDYLVSLPFFIFFPIPERWAYPESQAMLLSDKWSDKLIEAIRPMSGIDNCFPSFHVSMTVLVIVASLAFGLHLRTCVLALGLTVVLATFVLGIHWLPDILAGAALGTFSVLWAARLVRAQRLEFLWSWPASIFPWMSSSPAR